MLYIWACENYLVRLIFKKQVLLKRCFEYQPNTFWCEFLEIHSHPCLWSWKGVKSFRSHFSWFLLFGLWKQSLSGVWDNIWIRKFFFVDVFVKQNLTKIHTVVPETITLFCLEATLRRCRDHVGGMGDWFSQSVAFLPLECRSPCCPENSDSP